MASVTTKNRKNINNDKLGKNIKCNGIEQIESSSWLNTIKPIYELNILLTNYPTFYIPKVVHM